MSAPSPTPTPATPEALLAEHGWARRLARRLVRDADAAEDLAQEAAMRALGKSPEGLRAWLAGVVRNLARDQRRASARRERRERLAARPEALPSAADALERLAVQQDVVRAVLELAEPYRSTVVLRFYGSLPPRAIAARLGVPVATVKTRLARGLALLRERLDREHGGDGRAWALFLAPLAERATPLLPLAAGALAVNALPKLLAAAAITVGAVLWLATRENLPRERGEEVAHARAPAELEPAALPEEPAPAEPRREPAPEPASAKAAEVAAAPSAAETLVHGRVLDTRGQPVGGVHLGMRGSRGVRIDTETSSSILWDEELDLAAEPLAVSAADGSFEFARGDGAGGYVVAQDARWETVLGGGVRGALERERILVVAPLFRLRGRVVDAAGAPVEGAELAFVVPRDELPLHGLDLEGSRSNGFTATSDDDGRFAFERLPAVPEAKLHVRREPYEKQALAREWRDDEIEIVLAEPAGGWLEGVVESRGAPRAGATVALGHRAAVTGADGAFRLSLAGLGRERELVAVAAGFLPARVSGDENEDGSVRWPAFLRIELDGEPLALAGVVVDERGEPLAGHEVWLGDPGVAFVGSAGFPTLLESIVAGRQDMRHGTKTDERGRFELGSLEERDYTLRVIDPATGLVADHGPFAAGSRDLRLARAEGALWPRLRGKVVTRSGAPVAGARVDVEGEETLVGAGEHYFAFNAHGPQTTTAADGSFELPAVPRERATLHVRGADVADPELALDARIDADALEVRVAASVQLRVRVSGDTHEGATHFLVLDAAGEPVELTTPTDGGSRIAHSVELSDGMAPIARLSDDGVTLVLRRGEEELARVPLALRTGEVNVVEL